MVGNAVKLGKIPILKWLKVDDVKIPEFRLHSHFDDHSDFEESIKADGVIQPIYVFEDESGVYWLADGQNRLETAKSQGKPMVPAYVMHGSEKDAILYSAKLNVLRGKVNVGELAEFILNLHRDGFKVEELANILHLSKGYVSKLLAVAQNSDLLEKVKDGSLGIKEAYEKSFTVKQVSEETRYEEKPTTPMKTQPLTDEDLGLTSNFKQALEEGKRFKPLDSDDLKPEAEPKKTEYMTCDYCGKILSRLDVKWIKVHSEEYDKVLLAIHSLAERETRNESSQP